MSKKCFPAHLDQLYQMLDFIQEEGKKCHSPPPLLNSIILAVEEAVVNVIEYAYPERPDGRVEIEVEDYKEGKTGICITIRDQGVPFNPIKRFRATSSSPSSFPKLSLPVEQAELGGYGIPLLIGLMDGVDYERIEEENILYLIKYF